MYTALVLDSLSQRLLIDEFLSSVPSEWEIYCHHMTINLGDATDGPAANLVGQRFEVTVKTFAQDERVCAVGVETVVPSNNAIKHITIAANIDHGGKARHSNDLKEWHPIDEEIVLSGIVEICHH